MIKRNLKMYIFIVNPTAGNGKAEKIYRRLKETDIFKKMNIVSYHTDYKGHAEELIEQLYTFYDKRTIEAIVVIGGDGTMHEVINGLKNWQVPISFIPGGSGNDFIRGISMSDSPEKIMQALLKKERPVEYWIGEFTPQQRKRRFFVNCFGIGFDAQVSKRANQFYFKKWLHRLHLSSLIYLLSLLYELMRYKPIELTMEVDGEPIHFERVFLLTISNHPYFGGGMKINPLAHNNGQTLSILVIDSISKWKVLALLGTVFTGKHLQFKGVHTFEGREITLSSESPVPYQTDGETGTTQHVHVNKKGKPVHIVGYKNE